MVKTNYSRNLPFIIFIDPYVNKFKCPIQFLFLTSLSVIETVLANFNCSVIFDWIHLQATRYEFSSDLKGVTTPISYGF